MKGKYKVMIGGLVAVAILIAALATSAFAASRANVPETQAAVQTAQPGSTPITVTEADYQSWGCPLAGGSYEALTKLLGMTAQEIEAELEQGKSLVEIAAAKGINEEMLVAALITPMKEFMQQQVTSGNWTQEQLDARLKLAEQHVRQIINAKGGADYDGCGGGGMMGGLGANSYGRGGMMDGWGAGSGNTYGRNGMMGGYGGMMGGWGRSY